jgi:CheY-like chemotaxis protein
VPNNGTILLAEDNSDDVLLIRMAFKRAGFLNPIEVVSNGEKAIQYLRGEAPYSDRTRFPVPQILLLDLKMPRFNGFEVLGWIRNRAEWKCLPIIILTTSFYGTDIEQAYELGANSFLTKPAQFDEFVAAVKQMGDFWLGHTLLPAPGPFIPAPGIEQSPLQADVQTSHRNISPTEKSARAQNRPASWKKRAR